MYSKYNVKTYFMGTDKACTRVLQLCVYDTL